MEGTFALLLTVTMVKKVPTSLVESCLHLKIKMKSELERLEGLQMLRKVKRAYILCQIL